MSRDIVQQSASARDEQFLDLLGRHRVQLFGFIFCMVRRAADAEDVFQQASLTLWDKFDEFRPGSDFMAWASQVARFKALEFLRARRRDRVRCFSDELIQDLPAQALWNGEGTDRRLEALAHCRGKLSATDQRLLALCYGGEGSIAEAARRVDRPAASVYVSLSRIRRALLTCVQHVLASEGTA